MLYRSSNLSARLAKLAVMLSTACALLLFPAVIEAQENKTTTSKSMSGGYQVLTPTGGVDFSRYMQNVLLKIRSNWLAAMPEAAAPGAKGRAIVRFQIQKDGTLLTKELAVELSSGDRKLDKAATSATRSSPPFKPLPGAFQGPAIELRFVFNYNLANVKLPVSPQKPDATSH